MKKLTKIFVLLLSVALVLGALMMVISADTEAEVVYKTSEGEDDIKYTTDALTDEDAIKAGYVVKMVNGNVTTFGNVKWLEAKFDPHSDGLKTTPDYKLLDGEVYHLIDNVAINTGCANDSNKANLDKVDGVGGTITFDLNGKNLKVLSGNMFMIDQGKEMKAHNIIVTNYVDAKATIEANTGSAFFYVLRAECAHFTIEGNIEFNGTILYRIANSGSSDGVSNLTINGGTYNMNGNSLIYNDGAVSNKPGYPGVNATIKNATITGTSAVKPLLVTAAGRTATTRTLSITVENTTITPAAGGAAILANQHTVIKLGKGTVVNSTIDAGTGAVILDRGAIIGGYTGEVKTSAYTEGDVTGASAGIYVTSGNKLAENGGVYTVVKDSAFATAEDETAIDFIGDSINVTDAEALAMGYVVKVVTSTTDEGGVTTTTTGYGNVRYFEALLNAYTNTAGNTVEDNIFFDNNGTTYTLLTDIAVNSTKFDAALPNLDLNTKTIFTIDLAGNTLKVISGTLFNIDQFEHNVTVTSSKEGGKIISDDAVSPIIAMHRSAVTTINVSNVTIEAGYLFCGGAMGSTANTDIGNITFENCTINQIGGAAFIQTSGGGNYGSNKMYFMGTITFNKCTVSQENYTGTNPIYLAKDLSNNNRPDDVLTVAFVDSIVIAKGNVATVNEDKVTVSYTNTTVTGKIAAGAGKVLLGEKTKFVGLEVTVGAFGNYSAAGAAGVYYAAEGLTHSLIDKTTYMVATTDYVFPTVATITFYHGKGFVNSTSTLCLIDEVPTAPETIVQTYKDGDVIYRFAGWALEGSEEVVDSFAAITEGETTRAYYAVYVVYSDYAFTVVNGDNVTTYNDASDLQNMIVNVDMLVDGDTIVLNKSFAIYGYDQGGMGNLTTGTKSVGIDLNGYTLTIESGILFDLNNGTQNITVKSSKVGGAIISNGVDPIIRVKRNNHDVTIIGADDEGNTTLTVYASRLLLAQKFGSHSGSNVVLTIDGGDYYQTSANTAGFITIMSYFYNTSALSYYVGSLSVANASFTQTEGVAYACPIISSYYGGDMVQGVLPAYDAADIVVENCTLKARNNKSMVHDMANQNATIIYNNCTIYGDIGFIGYDNYAGSDGFTNGDVGTGIVVINGGFYTYCSTEIKAYDAEAIAKFDGSASGVYYGAEGLASFMYNGGYKVCPEADTETIEIYWCDENGEEVFKEGIYYGGSDAFDEDGNYLGAPTSAIVPPVKVEGSVFGQMVHNGKWEYEADGTTLIAYAVMEEANSTQGAAPQYFVNAYLGTKLGVNFYIPAELTLISAYANGEEIQFSEDVCVIGGVEYRFVTVEVAANRVFNATEFEITFAEGEKEYTFEVGVSVIEYAKNILADTEGVYTTAEDKAMVTAMLEYLRVAYSIMGYLDYGYAEVYRQFNAILGEKGEITVGEGTAYESADVGLTINVNLEASPEYVITMTDAAITKVEVEMSGVKYEFLPKGLDEEGKEIDTLTHTFNGTGRVSDFDDTVTVTIYKGEESVTITYTLDNYLYQLINAEKPDVRYNETVALLKAYIEAAKAYVA